VTDSRVAVRARWQRLFRTPADIKETSLDEGNVEVDGPSGITAGPDGALWFTYLAGGTYGTGGIGRITTSGQLSYPGTGSSIVNPTGITAGPDGALWFTNNSNNTIGRITTPAPQTITFTSTPPSPAVYGGKYTPTGIRRETGRPHDAR
jgi:sugar lactone lactonase YvrE